MTFYHSIRTLCKSFATIGALQFASTADLAAQTTKDYQTDAIQQYFTERIQRHHLEEVSINFDGKKEKLQAKDVTSKKAQIWEIWRKVNAQIDSLPRPHINTGPTSEEAPQLNRWELIGENPMPFYFIKKTNQASGNSDERLPLFINMHGSGPKANELRATTAWSLRFEDRESYYFIPQIPSEQRYRWWYRPIQYTWERLLRLSMLQGEIDPNKIYVMGISEGGYGSQRVGAFYADYLAGAGPMAGGEPLENAPPLNYRHVAFSLQTGENDHGFGRNTLTQKAKEVFAELQQTNPGDFTHKIELQAGRGHGIDYTVTTPWLRNFSRVTRPKHITWVQFPMHERYRKGFYNIALNEALPVKEGEKFDRVLFDIKFNDNLIEISAEKANKDLSEREALDNINLTVFLDEAYVDFSKKVKVRINGKQVANKKLQLDARAIVESCALFADPERLYPAKLEVKL